MDDRIKADEVGVLAAVETQVPALAVNMKTGVSSLLLKLDIQKGAVLSGIAVLLETASLDETDRRTISEARMFIETPAENLADIMVQTNHIGEVVGGYEMNGEEAPLAIDSLHAYLLSLQCINRINFIEREIESGVSDSPEVSAAMVSALDVARILSRGYKDETLLIAVREIEERLKNLP